MAILEPRDDNDWEQFTRLTAQSFGYTDDDADRRISALRPSAIARFELEGDQVIAGALALPCQQYFGGRPVPAAAVTSLCVAPQARGAGLGRRVMWSLADAIGREGLAVAPTYSTSSAFLRGLGWEICGQSFAFAAPADAFVMDEPAGEAVRDPDQTAVRALRARTVAAWSGPVERPSWWWNWLGATSGTEVRLGWVDGGELQGYLAYRTVPDPHGPENWGMRVVVTDLLTQSRSALDGLLRILGTERPISPTVAFDYGVLPPDTSVRYRIATTLAPTGVRDWMLRVLSPEAALAAAGWPTISGRLEIEVAALGRAASVMSVEFAAGSAAVGPGASPRVRMSTGGFAAWFAGALPATQAARLGIASGPAEDLAFMDLLVADRRPWLPETF